MNLYEKHEKYVKESVGRLSNDYGKKAYYTNKISIIRLKKCMNDTTLILIAVTCQLLHCGD